MVSDFFKKNKLKLKAPGCNVGLFLKARGYLMKNA